MSFAPSLSWEGCGSDPGTQRVKLVKGAVWPLKLDSAWSYSMDGGNVTGGSWSGNRDCKVIGTARIEVLGREHDTYKLVCDEPWGDKTYYISPTLQKIVKRIDYHNRRGTTTYERKLDGEQAGKSS